MIPDTVSSALSHVSRLTDFLEIKHMGHRPALDHFKRGVSAVPAECDPNKVTPACLRRFYETQAYQPAPSSQGGPDITIMGYIGQYVGQEDLTVFLKKYRPDAAGYQIPIKTAAGGINNPDKPGVEAMLDVETVVAQTYPLRSEFLSFDTPDAAHDIFAETFDYFVSGPGAAARPSVISISYGARERDAGVSGFDAMCKSAQQLTALGTTIVLSSGDAGVSGLGFEGQDVCAGTAALPYLSTYPSGCPYIASVGATQGFSPEKMVNNLVPSNPVLAIGFFSGAGRSNFFRSHPFLPSPRGSRVRSCQHGSSPRLVQQLWACVSGLRGQRMAVCRHLGWEAANGQRHIGQCANDCFALCSPQ